MDMAQSVEEGGHSFLSLGRKKYKFKRSLGKEGLKTSKVWEKMLGRVKLQQVVLGNVAQ